MVFHFEKDQQKLTKIYLKSFIKAVQQPPIPLKLFS